jgi:hypothetical protein
MEWIDAGLLILVFLGAQLLGILLGLLPPMR